MRELPLPTMPLSDLRSSAAPRRSLHPRSESLETAGPDSARFDVVWARNDDDVRQAQQLRYLVFAQEMGARLSVPQGAPPEHDIDMFDAYCEHLLVRTPATDGEPGSVIGTYRVLTPAAAKRVGGLYSDTEFDLTRLRPLRAKMVELGRSCVHPAWRSGGAILALWGALAEFMVRDELDTMDELRSDLSVEAPALIKGYLRCGAKVLGPPAWDPDFNTADLPMLMRIADLPSRYRKHFLGA
jgi:putative hemolysin